MELELVKDGVCRKCGDFARAEIIQIMKKISLPTKEVSRRTLCNGALR